MPCQQPEDKGVQGHSWKARGGHQGGRCKEERQRHAKRGGPQEREVMSTWKKRWQCFAGRTQTNSRQCSALGRKNIRGSVFGVGMQNVAWFTILTWKTLTVSQTAHSKVFGKSCTLTVGKPALHAPGSSYSTNTLTDEYVQKVLQQK